MAETQPACGERSEIADSIRVVLEHIVALQTVEIEAIQTGGNDELARLEDDIKKAMTMRASLMERLQAHVRSHGCEPKVQLLS